MRKLPVVSIKMDEELKVELQNYSKKHDLSMSQIVRFALKEYLKQAK